MEQYLGEAVAVRQIAAPGSAASAAITGDRVSLANGDRVAMIIDMGASTGATASFSLKQHTAASGGTSKALAVSNPYYKKAVGAGVSTKVTPGSAADTYDLSSDFVTAGGVVIFEVLAEDLDVNNGFAFVSLDVATSVTAKTFAGVYVLRNGRNWPMYQASF